MENKPIMYTPQELKILRVRLGNLSQAEFASQLGCPQQTVARWESGRKISEQYLIKITKLEESLNKQKKEAWEPVK